MRGSACTLLVWFVLSLIPTLLCEVGLPCPSCQISPPNMAASIVDIIATEKQWGVPPNTEDYFLSNHDWALRECVSAVGNADYMGRWRCPALFYPKRRWFAEAPHYAVMAYPIPMEMIPSPFYAQVMFKNYQTSSECNTEYNGNVQPYVCYNSVQVWGEKDTQKCLQCLAVATSRPRASNGEYSIERMPVSPVTHTPYGDSGALFRSCEAGTWNTCRTLSACTYPVQWVSPQSVNRMQSNTEWYNTLNSETVDINYNVVLGDLIGGCYPCNKAEMLSHYGTSMPPVPLEYSSKGYLPFWCKGGAEAPAKCDKNMVAVVDDQGLAGSPCVCIDSFYLNADKACVPCLPGYVCSARFGMQPCPAGTYSPGGLGGTSCTPCSQSSCGDPSTVRSRCTGVASTVDTSCVNCALCRSLGCEGAGCVDCQSVFV